MPELSINEIVEITGGDPLNISGNERFTNFEFDSRNISDKNTLFFALSSDTGDGHKFVPGLVEFSGVGAVVNRNFDGNLVDIPLIVVEDPLKAAHKLAAFVRNKFRKIKYVGITGSAGKTTSKEFLSQILGGKFKVFKSGKNWNNWIGMPFSILKIKGDEDVAVFELAMSYPGIGEIDLLADILRPDLAMILNVFPVHMEFLKTLKNVAKGKAEILNYMAADGVSFITGDSEYIKNEIKDKRGRKVFFGKVEGANDIVLKSVERNGNGTSFFIDFYGIEYRFETNLISIIHMENLFAAIVAAQSLGMKNFEISEAIKKIEPVDGRGQIEESGNFTIVNETYNSNPVALKKALEWVDNEFDSDKIAVIGDMLELGDEEEKYHFEVGSFFSGLNYKLLITVGEKSESVARGAVKSGFPEKSIKRFKSSAEAGEFIRDSIKENCTILFKASRGVGMENAIKKIKNEK